MSLFAALPWRENLIFCLNRCSSQRLPRREKREDISLIFTYMGVGQGESGPPSPIIIQDCLSTPLQSLPICCCCCCCSAAVTSNPTLGSWARHSVLNPLGLKWGWLVPLLLLVPLPETRPSSSLLFLHLLLYQPAMPNSMGKGREGVDSWERGEIETEEGSKFIWWAILFKVVVYCSYTNLYKTI